MKDLLAIFGRHPRKHINEDFNDDILDDPSNDDDGEYEVTVEYDLLYMNVKPTYFTVHTVYTLGATEVTVSAGCRNEDDDTLDDLTGRDSRKLKWTNEGLYIGEYTNDIGDHNIYEDPEIINIDSDDYTEEQEILKEFATRGIEMFDDNEWTISHEYWFADNIYKEYGLFEIETLYGERMHTDDEPLDTIEIEIKPGYPIDKIFSRGPEYKEFKNSLMRRNGLDRSSRHSVNESLDRIQTLAGLIR